tara:strand:- start:4661 stop:4966 length:306 start_codon:yes stop_codon:yes gene_type:complete
MIDTDKYEGHTGPWKLNKPDEYGDYTIQDDFGRFQGRFYSRFRVQDARLMADAPLLLDRLIKAEILIAILNKNYAHPQGIHNYWCEEQRNYFVRFKGDEEE